jgi:hypothetical protein
LYQCVVAGKPFRIPAAPKINAPVLTETVQVVASCLRSQSSTSSSTIWLGVLVPPGTSTRSGDGVSATVCETPSRIAPPSLMTGPTSLPTKPQIRIGYAGQHLPRSHGIKRRYTRIKKNCYLKAPILSSI